MCANMFATSTSNLTSTNVTAGQFHYFWFFWELREKGEATATCRLAYLKNKDSYTGIVQSG